MKWRRERRPDPPAYNVAAAAPGMPATNRELSAAVHDLADAVRANAPRSSEFTIPREFIEAFRDGAYWQFDISPLLEVQHMPQRPSMVVERHGREFRIVFKRDDGTHFYTFILREP